MVKSMKKQKLKKLNNKFPFFYRTREEYFAVVWFCHNTLPNNPSIIDQQKYRDEWNWSPIDRSRHTVSLGRSSVSVTTKAFTRKKGELNIPLSIPTEKKYIGCIRITGSPSQYLKIDMHQELRNLGVEPILPQKPPKKDYSHMTSVSTTVNNVETYRSICAALDRTFGPSNWRTKKAKGIIQRFHDTRFNSKPQTVEFLVPSLGDADEEKKLQKIIFKAKISNG